MKPNSETSPSMHLPEPMQANPETAPELAAGNDAVGAQERAGATAAAPPAFSLPNAPASPSGGNQAAPGGSSWTSGQLTADDRDTIEREWVLKAKQIIASTIDDPREQNNQLAAFKADYIQKRYGKTIKLSE